MTWPVLLGFLVAGLGGLLVPRLVALVPEPEPEPADDLVGPDSRPDPTAQPEAKVPYAEIAASRGLGPRCGVVSGLAGAALGAALGPDWALLFLLPLVPVLVALSVVDWRTRLLPTWLIARTYVGLVVLVLVATAAAGFSSHGVSDLVRAGWGWLIAGVLFFVLWFVHPRGLGYGDVRLSGVLGIALGHLGWGELLAGLYSAFLIGGLGGALLSWAGLADRRGVPFGPFMVLGALVGVLLGPWTWSHLVAGGG